jgi:fatty acid desaturase
MPETRTTASKPAGRSTVQTLWRWRAEALWGIVAVILLFAFVNPVLLIGVWLAFATVVVAWLGFAELLRRADRDDAQPAAATHPRPASASRLEPTDIPAHTPWQGHQAA